MLKLRLNINSRDDNFVFPMKTLTNFILSHLSKGCDLLVFLLLKTLPVIAKVFWVVRALFLEISSCLDISL